MRSEPASTVRVDAIRLGESPWAFVDMGVAGLLDRFKALPSLGTFCDIARGLETGWDDLFFLTATEVTKSSEHITVTSAVEPHGFSLEKALVRRLVKGAVDIRRYEIVEGNRYLLFPYRHMNDEAQLIRLYRK